ncbi:MAG: hypothetical protein ACRDAO_02545, partial [Culicoidibacterales bacterium]
AVMVIVGIIAAISIPAIGNLIENTRKDAYIATGKNLQEAARLVASQNADKCSSGCVVRFAGTVPTDAIDGSKNIENIDPAYTTAYVNVTNSNGNVSYATLLIGSDDKTYTIGTSASDAMTWERKDVERVVKP